MAFHDFNHLGLAVAAIALCPAAALAGQGTDTLPALQSFVATGGALDVRFNISHAADATKIGDIPVKHLDQLNVCNADQSVCADPYAGAALELGQTDTLRVTLTNDLQDSEADDMMRATCMDSSKDWDKQLGWSAKGKLANKHYHGMLTRPDQGMNGEPNGDFIFDCTHPADANGQNEKKTVQYEIKLSDAGEHPAGINWFHPHIHGIAKPQVSNGMAGMILVNPDCSQTGATENPICDESLPKRPILLKDAQLLQQENGDWLNFADQTPDFCGGDKKNVTNIGECRFDYQAQANEDGSTSDLQTAVGDVTGKWVFTLNGARYPRIVVGEPGGQIWRVQNASANITYRLVLRRIVRRIRTRCRRSALQRPVDGRCRPASGTGGAANAPETREILLMPGSRADSAGQAA
ncbi:MAG: hypothetical protein R3C97_09280 [Geminicoccaceae bacterium]